MTDREYIDVAVAAITTVTLVNWDLCPCIVNYSMLRPRIHALIAHDVAQLLTENDPDEWERKAMYMALGHIDTLNARRKEFCRHLHGIGAGVAFEEVKREENGIQPSC